jgi:hypothetical protein
MKTFRNTKTLSALIAISTSFLIAVFACVSFAQEEAADPGWPRMFESNGNKVVVYQPQLDEWVDYKTLKGKAAAVVELKGDDKTYYGALDIEADSETDHESRIVLLKNFRITQYIFPSIEEKLAEKCTLAVKDALPKGKIKHISLDRILAGLEATKEKAKGVAVNLDPPPIYKSEKPAILVLFMGEPKFKAVENMDKLLFAVNTNWDVLHEDGSSKYYLLNGKSWLVTKDIKKGPWEAAKTVPGSFTKLPDNDNWKAVKKHVPGVKPKEVPEIFVSTEPAELIVTYGTPNYSPIPDTKLMYVTNTDSDLFLHIGAGKYYFLTAGRWFRADSLDGPWSAASTELPDDFSMIPTDHAKGYVLSSVPGTPDAEAAVLLASVPRKATVNRKDTKVTVVYEGEPEFVEIKDTKTVYYAVNTPYNVFRVDKEFYCVHDGVWFVSTNATGPWVVATQVPAVIYTIPSNHPKHNVTYVYIYDTTPDTVIVGYTSGYTGTYIVTTGVVMYGYGYWMRDDYWYNYHHYHYHPYYYSYGHGYRYDYYYGNYYRGARYYGPYGGVGGVAGYNPATGTYYRGGYAQGPYGRAFAGQAYNPYTDRYAARAGAKTPYGSWGRTVVADGDKWARGGHRSQGGKTAAGFETSEGAKAIGGYNKQTGQGGFIGKDKYGDVYAGRDGNVYKKGDDGWQKNTGKGWENVDTSAARKKAETRTDSTRKKYQSGSMTTQQRDKLSQYSTQRKTDPTRQRTQSGGLTAKQRDRLSQYSTSSGRSSSSRTRNQNLNRDYSARQRGNQRASTYRKSRSSGSRSNIQRSGGSRSRSSGASRGGGSRGGGGRGGGGGRRR